jgi:transposase InsO family protein
MLVKDAVGGRNIKPLMGKVMEPKGSWSVVHLDAVGPLQSSANGNRYNLTFVDSFSKFADAFPVKEISAVTCARIYAEQVVTRHGINEVLVSDNGKNFTATFFEETCRLLGFKHITTTPYHPSANGQAERLHRTLKKVLGCFVNSAGND